jgi:4-hydroxy-3-methylbut-2-enyl diphosphate reductase
MKFEIEKASRTGFCFGVKRAIETLTKSAAGYGGVEVLGAIVHNQQVTERLASAGIKVAPSIDDIKGNIATIGSHGVSPQVESMMKGRFQVLIDTTCPFVRRAQTTARQLNSDGFMVIIYGEKEHPEVRGILGYADDKGIATMDTGFLASPQRLPRKIGVLSQTTQVPARFVEFSQQIVGSLLDKDVELRFADTICHDIRERQQSALEVAHRVDLMLVVGSHTSANSNHLAELCATVTQSHLVETAGGIDRSWLKGCQRIGVTSGSSTAEETVDDVVARLKELSGYSPIP